MMKRLSTSPVCTILDTCLSSFNLSTKAEKKEEKFKLRDGIKSWPINNRNLHLFTWADGPINPCTAIYSTSQLVELWNSGNISASRVSRRLRCNPDLSTTLLLFIFKKYRINTYTYTCINTIRSNTIHISFLLN
jgi:hypothetical protein